jgi:hypothetical protein
MMPLKYATMTQGHACLLEAQRFLIAATNIHFAIDHRAAVARLLAMTSSSA